MTVQQEVQKIISNVKSWKWTPELFQRVNDILNYTNIFNVLRRELTEEEYEQFDMEYCEHFRPGQKALAKYIKEKRGEMKWREKKRELLQKKKQLLQKKLQT